MNTSFNEDSRMVITCQAVIRLTFFLTQRRERRKEEKFFYRICQIHLLKNLQHPHFTIVEVYSMFERYWCVPPATLTLTTSVIHVD